MNTDNLKVGDILEAIDVCEMSESKEHALIVGKQYKIKEVDSKQITIKSEVDKEHTFPLYEVKESFKLVAKPMQDPKTMTIKEKAKLLKALAKVVKATEKNSISDGTYSSREKANEKIQEILKTINVD